MTREDQIKTLNQALELLGKSLPPAASQSYQDVIKIATIFSAITDRIIGVVNSLAEDKGNDNN